jgi:Protein of unknown function (DUF3800)
MHIFIDEAGAFIPGSTMGPPTYSLVLALVVPTAAHDDLCYEFLRTRDGWPNNAIELKGSSLDEAQCAEVARLLVKYDCLIEMQIIDMGKHDVACIEELKERQAQYTTANITPAHQATIIQQTNDIANAFRAMSNQLFVQAFLSIELVIEVADIAPLYYVQRVPQELGSFTWLIDRKDRDLTLMERTWSTFILPAGEFRSRKKPGTRLAGADYSHFTKYQIHESDANPEWAKKIAWMRQTYSIDIPPGEFQATDWKKLISEDRAFADSKSSLGLQLADITATSIRRALKANLQQQGWEPFGQLLIHKKSLPFCMIGRPPRSTKLEEPAKSVWQVLSAHSKLMIA